jgi:hypothetical protein
VAGAAGVDGVAALLAVGAAGAAGWAGALPIDAGRTDLLLPMRLAWASEGTVSDAMARAITEAVARNEVFT